MNEPLPERIGDYRIERELGRGEFGRVFLAHTEDLQRPVAVKWLRADRATPAVRERFRAECAALGMMEHDGVAKIFAAGEAGGLPFLAMEFVEGEPLTGWCDAASATLATRLLLFARVCHGVEHAHQKGIIHRDLKPAHILVTSNVEGPRPKIIDFGLARGDDFALVPGHATVAGEVLGAIAYMSPEQCGGRRRQIDTRTDLYALGVVLHELLSGCLPAVVDELQDLDLAGVLARLQAKSGEVARPSARLAALAQRDPGAAAAVARARGMSLPELQRQLAGDLDAIVAKAMAADREHRYQTASALAEDLGRFLRHEPVAACPPTRTYRFRKFVRRHRAQVAVAAVLIVALLAVTLTAVWGASLARENERLGRLQLAEAAARQRANARALVVAGKTAAQRGQWATALDCYRRARSSDYEDTIELAIFEILALEGNLEFDRAQEAVRDLLARPDLGSRRATVLLLDADLGVDRLADPDGKLDRAALALELENAQPNVLAEADVCYARAILAGRPREALDWLRRGRAADPFHHRINAALAISLLLLGELAEARRFGDVFLALLPDDPEAAHYAVLTAGLAGDRAAVAERLAHIGKAFDEETHELAEQVANVAELAAWGNAEILAQAIDGDDSEDFVAELKRIGLLFLQLHGRASPLLRYFRERSPAVGRLAEGAFLHRLPPSLVRGYRPLLGLLDGKRVRPQPWGAVFAELPTEGVDGALVFLRALGLSTVDGPAAAVDPLATALTMPSALIARETMLYNAILIAAFVLLDDKHPLPPERVGLVGQMLDSWLREAAATATEAKRVRFLFLASRALADVALQEELAVRWWSLADDNDAEAAASLLETTLGDRAIAAKEAVLHRLEAAGLGEPVWRQRMREVLERLRR